MLLNNVLCSGVFVCYNGMATCTIVRNFANLCSLNRIFFVIYQDVFVEIPYLCTINIDKKFLVEIWEVYLA